MKKITKLLLTGCLSAAFCAAGFGVAGCIGGNPVVEGEYHYSNYGKEYGVKVSVEIQHEAQGDRIARVTIDTTSGYIQLSDANDALGWTDSNRQNYLDGEQGLLNTYRGMYVEDVLALNAGTDEIGQPTSVDSSVGISGATQSSGRLLLAVQDALCNYGYTLLYGQYHYPNAWDDSAPHYGIKVKLVMKGNVVKRVVIVDSDFVSVTDSWEDKATWNEGLDDLLASYAGLTKTEILHMSATTNEDGQPESVSEGAPVITGATQGSGRLLLAVQNALDPVGHKDSPVIEEQPGGDQEGFIESEHIDVDATKYEVDGKNVKYNIVTLANSPAQPFTVTMTVGEDKTVSDFTIVVNGSSPASFADKMADLAKLINGKNVDELKALLTGDDISTGATRSNELCVYAAIFATANYDYALNNEQPGGGEDNPGEDNPGEEEPEEEAFNRYVNWQNSQYIDGATTFSKDYFGNVLYNIVTTENGRAGSFELRIVVNSQKVITEYEIIKNGSKPASFADRMAAVAKNLVGKTEAELQALLAGDDLHTGATKSNELCVNAALFAVSNYNIAAADEYIGEYKYENAWVAGSYYGIKVAVRVADGKIVEVIELDSDYTSVTDSWANKQIWIDGLADLLKAYQGKTVEEILAVPVSVATNGQPEAVADSNLMITGATQGSGRLLLAVQNALSAVEDNYVRTYIGEYKYENAWVAGSYYGIKVAVTVKGDKIIKVEVLDSDYTSVTDSWEDKNIWINGLEDLLAAYAGKTVDEVLSVAVTTAANGQPEAVADPNFMITGATQGSGRLLLAVQNALDPTGENTARAYIGEYKYENAWVAGSYYGIKVAVTVKSGVVLKVEVLDSEYTSVTDSWDNKEIWINGLANLLKAYEGRTVDEILSVAVTTAANGQPEAVADSNLMITGATQGSGRLLLAVQNALDPTGENTTRAYLGEYSYANPWSPDAPHYGIEVSVTVKGNVIQKVEVVDTKGYVSVTDSWDNKEIWINGLANLLKAYEGLTVEELFAATATVDADGQPTAVSNPDLMITGATQGSGRLLLAVQNALAFLDPNPDEPSQPENPYEEWEYSDYIDAATTYTANDDGSVTYNIVTASNGAAGSFEITVTVKDGAVTAYEITKNGSTSGFDASMYENIQTYMVGKKQADLEAFLDSEDIKTGATRSNELCVYAALFALANAGTAAAE